MPTHYEILGVLASATDDEIKVAYRKLIRKNHPDLVGPSGEATTRLLNLAMQDLSGPSRRSAYDRTLIVHSEFSEPVAPEDEPPVFVPRPSPPRPTGMKVRGYEGGSEYQTALNNDQGWSRKVYWFWRNTWLVSVAAVSVSGLLPVFWYLQGDHSVPLLVVFFCAAIFVATFTPRPHKILLAFAGVGVLFWPLSLFKLWPFLQIIGHSPGVFYLEVMVTGVAAAAVRMSAIPALAYWKSRPLKNRSK